MILSPISAFGNALIPQMSNANFLPQLQQPQGTTAAGLNLFPSITTTAATNAAVAALAAAQQNPYMAALAAAGLSPNGTMVSSPTSSYFEGMPIYLLSNTNTTTPFVMPKLPEIPLNLTGSPASQQRVDTSKHFHVFVGDLSSEIDNKALREAFVSFGEISEAKVIRDLQTLKSKGYGFVTYVKREDAERAIEQMNGQWLGRRTIRTNWASRKLGSLSSSNVSIARERERERDRDRNNEADQGGDQSNDDCGPPPARRRQIKNLTYEEIMSQASPVNSTVYVGGITSAITDDELKQAFGKYGTIVETRIFRQQGYAFVKFELKESAGQAILLTNNTEINSCPIRCSWGKEGGGTSANSVNQPTYNFGYNFAAAAGNSLNNIWSQYYQCYNNPTLLQQWQAYWQQQPQLGAHTSFLMNSGTSQ